MKELLEKPSLSEAEKALKEYLIRDVTVQVNGLCSVNYQGRASSKLDRGERLVIKKQDSALLVHGPENYQPKNWQPEVDTYNIEIDEENKELVLEARRKNPDELVEIRFEEIEAVIVTQLVDKSDLKIRGHEIDIHDSIEDKPELIEKGMKVVEREKENSAGFIDIFALDETDSYVVIEVKRNPDYNSVIQLKRYVDEIKQEFSGTIRGILVAPKMTDKILDYIDDKDLEFVEIEMEDVIESYEGVDNSQRGLSDFKN